jgi:SAM-dependent methyltransferase
MNEQRLSFGANAELYDRARPSYPPELVADVVGLVGTPCTVLEVGCGTGKASVLFAGQGVSGVAVEPDEAMAGLARQNLAPFPGWSVEVGDFEAWEPAPSSPPFDLVIAAESWHWVSRRVGPKKADRLLRPGGWLAVFAYEIVRQGTALQDEIDAIYASHSVGPSFSQLAKARRFDPAGTTFGEVLRREYPSAHNPTAEQWCDNLRTSSDHTAMPPAQLEELLADVAGAIERHGGTYPHVTACKLWAVQKQGE